MAHFHPLQVQNAGTLTEIKVRALLIMNHVPKLNTQVWVDNLVRESPSYLGLHMQNAWPAPLARIPTGGVLAPRRTVHYACTTLVCAH